MWCSNAGARITMHYGSGEVHFSILSYLEQKRSQKSVLLGFHIYTTTIFTYADWPFWLCKSYGNAWVWGLAYTFNQYKPQLYLITVPLTRHKCNVILHTIGLYCPAWKPACLQDINQSIPADVNCSCDITIANKWRYNHRSSVYRSWGLDTWCHTQVKCNLVSMFSLVSTHNSRDRGCIILNWSHAMYDPTWT